MARGGSSLRCRTIVLCEGGGGSLRSNLGASWRRWHGMRIQAWMLLCNVYRVAGSSGSLGRDTAGAREDFGE